MEHVQRAVAETVEGKLQPAEADLARIQGLYDTGQLFDAWRATLHLAPIRDWRSPESRILGGRLSHQLGAPSMANALMLLAWRHAPEHQPARYFGIRALLGRRGPLEALGAIERYPLPEEPVARAEWLALAAQILGLLRDFERAEERIAEARALAPAHHWIALESASLLELQDRPEEALAEARRGYDLQPLHPGATLAVAHLLVLLGRDEEAIAVLYDSLTRIQSGAIASMSAMLLTEHERYLEAVERWESCQVLMPLIEKQMRSWLYGNLSHIQYLAGKVEESKRLAIESGDPVLAKLAARLDENAALQKRRVQIEVHFIRQHHVTCVPTTMAMIARRWGHDIEHLAVADEITYGGTATFRERAWLEKHGWAATEFTLTWDAAVALLDRGIPFTLTTTSGEQSHEQAVAGYDTHRRTLLVRDPSHPGLSEMDVESLLESHAAAGPRAMLMLPASEKHRLDGLDLPEARERDLLHEMSLALDRNDRDAAGAAAARVAEIAHEGRMAPTARAMLADYDRNPDAYAAAVDDLLRQFPRDTGMLIQKQRCLAIANRSAERVELLERLSNEGHPVFLRFYAEALSWDARNNERVLPLLKRYLRMIPTDPDALGLLANVVWSSGNFEEATKLYRLASCTGETNEALASSYFTAAAIAGRQEEALQFLRDRFRRSGARSPFPSRTLFAAFSQLHRLEEAFAVLNEAIALRPDDPELLLFAADASARHGRLDAAEELLRKAEPMSRRPSFLATRATVHRYAGRPKHAIESWREALEHEPLLAEGHVAMTELLSQTEGKPAAIRFVESLIERFPAHRPGHVLLATLTRDSDPALHERAVRRLLEIGPDDAWAHRELALHLANTRRIDEALAAVARAEEIEPAVSNNVAVRGQILYVARRLPEARDAFLRSIELLADDEWSYHGLAGSAADAKEREALLESVFPRALEKTFDGTAIAAVHAASIGNVDDERLLEMARRAVAVRPAIWQSHAMLIRQLERMGRSAEAAGVARDATARFPLQGTLWLDRARIHASLGETSEEKAALETALRIDPASAEAAVALSFVLHSEGAIDDSLRVLNECSARVPLDANLHWRAAAIAWERGDREGALRRLTRAAKLAPESEALWNELQQRAREAEKEELIEQTAAALVDERPGNPYSWLVMARIEEDSGAKLAAIEQALAADPQFTDAWLMKADVLAAEGRFDDALAVCKGPQKDAVAPLPLRGKEAWVVAASGDQARAIAMMQALVREEPNYTWGWYQLCQWYSQAQQMGNYRKAALELVRVEPQNALSWNYLADAEREQGDEEKAEEALERALALDPANVYAAANLVDGALRRREIDRAEQIAERALAASGHPVFALKKIEVAVARKRRGDAEAILRDLVVDASTPPDIVQDAVARMREAKWDREVSAALAQALRSEDVNPAAAAESIRTMRAKDRDRALGVIGELSGAAARAAANAYLELAAQGRRGWVTAFVERFGKWIADDVEIWGMIGYAWSTLGRFRECIAAMADWRKRTGVAPWALLNLSISYRSLREDAAARRVTDFALELPPDHTLASHQAWAGLDAAIAGDLAAAAGLLEQARRVELGPFDRLIAEIALALVAAEREGTEGGWRLAAQTHLREVVVARRAGELSPLIKRHYGEALALLSRRYGKFAARVWAWWWRMKV